MPKFISIDADAHGLLIAVGSAARDKLAVDTLIAAIDLAQPLSISNAPLVGQRLKQLLKDAGVAAAPAIVTIGRDRIILKEVKHPPVPPSEEPGVIRFAAMKEIADGGEDVVFDYLPMAKGAIDGEKRATVAFVKKDVVAAVRNMCEVAGLKLAAITPRPYAAAALLRHAAASGAVPAPEPTDAPVAVVVVHEGGGEFTICRNGVASFTRSIPSAAIASEDALLGEIRRNIAVASGQAGSDVQAIYISEAETRGEGWSGRLRAALGLPVYSFDPLDHLAAAGAIAPELHGRFLGPIGLLLAKDAGAVLPINFAQPRQPRRVREGGKSTNRVLLVAAIVLLALGVVSVGGYLLVDRAESKVRMLRKQIATADEDLKRIEIDGKRLAALEEYQAREVNWLDQFYEETSLFPDFTRMRLTNYEGTVKTLLTDKDRIAEAAKPAGKNAPPKIAATAHRVLVSDVSTVPEELATLLQRESKYYIGVKKAVLGPVGNNSKVQQFTIDSGLAHRTPEEYVRKLVASYPVKPPPIVRESKKPAAKADDKPKDDPLDDPAGDNS